MKKIAIIITVTASIVFTFFLLHIIYSPVEYTQNGQVIEKRMDGTESVILTWDGNLWISVDDFRRDTLVTVTFSDNGTDDITDDIILNVTER